MDTHWDTYQDSIDAAAGFIKIVKKLEKALGIGEKDWLGMGCSRSVYKYGHSEVIKIPYSYGGMMDNLVEAWLYDNALNGWAPLGVKWGRVTKFKPARCSIIDVEGVPCLVMERVRQLKPKRGCSPKWSNYLCDGRQVGKNNDGILVAFDFAMELDYEKRCCVCQKHSKYFPDVIKSDDYMKEFEL